MPRIRAGSAGTSSLAILWENFGPPHHDRIRALANAGHRVTAIQLFARSEDYDWSADQTELPVEFVTLARDRVSTNAVKLASQIVETIRSSGVGSVFLCHYNEISVFLAALRLRLLGVQVFTLLESKEDDWKRSKINWLARRIMMAPYQGAIVSGPRTRAYAASIGIPEDRSLDHHNTLDISVLRRLGQSAEIPPFADRPFLIVARLVPKKNIHTALRVFAQYRSAGGQRELEIAGEGPEGPKLKSLAQELGIDGEVSWLGNLDRQGVAWAMRRALALILPSTIEQFGYVVIEALAQGLVPIVTERAGAVDLLVSHGENGFVIDPEDERDLLEAMQMLDGDEAHWRRLSEAAYAAADRADCRHFAESATLLIEKVGH